MTLIPSSWIFPFKKYKDRWKWRASQKYCLDALGHKTVQSLECLAGSPGKPGHILPLLVDVVLQELLTDLVQSLNQPKLGADVLGLLFGLQSIKITQKLVWNMPRRNCCKYFT